MMAKKNKFPRSFSGFDEKTFRFLRSLKRNNKREWFHARREPFEADLLGPLKELVTDAAIETEKRGLSVTGSAKKSIFRIHRDIRFSANKDPYKTHLSAVLTRDGTKKDPGVVYIHVEPGASFVAAGFWMPDAPLLAKWRLEIAQDPTAFRKVVRRLAEKKLKLDEEGVLKRVPRGFERFKEAPFAPWLKMKSFVVYKELPDAKFQRADLVDAVADFASQAMPLLEYGWELVDRLRTGR